MKVACFAESPADQAALRILAEAVLGKSTEPVAHAGLEHRGWPSVRTVLPAVLKELHYHTDAEGFMLICPKTSQRSNDCFLTVLARLPGICGVGKPEGWCLCILPANSNGVASQSPGLRGTSYPGKASRKNFNRNAVVASVMRRPEKTELPQPRCGWKIKASITQGSSFLATLGLRAQSL